MFYKASLKCEGGTRGTTTRRREQRGEGEQKSWRQKVRKSKRKESFGNGKENDKKEKVLGVLFDAFTSTLPAVVVVVVDDVVVVVVAAAVVVLFKLLLLLL